MKKYLNNMNFIKEYGDDEKLLLRNHPSLDVLYTWSSQREGLIEWIPTDNVKTALLLHIDPGTPVAVLLRRGIKTTIISHDEEEQEYIMARYAKYKDLITIAHGHEDIEGKTYDSVWLISSDKDYKKRCTQMAQSHVSKDGFIVYASANSYGLKYMAGAALPDNHDTYEHMKSCFGENADAKLYYVMPDIYLPTTIYSDEHMPDKEELTGQLPLYDDAECAAMDVGAKYGQVVEDGKFKEYAGGYVLISKKVNPLYVKYNRTRKEEYRTKTVIALDDDGILRVHKTALSDAGKTHISSMLDSYTQLSSISKSGVSYLKPEISADGLTATYDYIKGMSLTKKLIEDISKGADEKQVIEEALDKVLSFNMDAIFDNFIVTESGYVGIDYEWVRKDADINFVRYRILHDFYAKAKDVLCEATEEEFMLLFDIDKTKTDSYIAMEREFQESIHGDNQIVYLDNYRVKQKTIADIREGERKLAVTLQSEAGLKAQVHNKDTQIRKMTEVKRLTDNHVTNLETIISNLRHDNEEMGSMLTYLRRHEPLYSKVFRKTKSLYNKSYPKGSLKRMKLVHPLKYLKLTTSAEGKNLIEGDKKIGDEYRLHGKLHIPQTDKPEVSIVIPAYNQIQYTYACIASIIDHTENIAYEIILADDVSTDATSEIGKFVEGLVISRNATNQGFLRNCNQAAAKARGRYIMFLNNDTKVTEDWLSALLRLIKSDESIGMVGSKLVYPDGKLQEAGGIIWSDGSGWNYGRMDDPDKCEYNYVRDVDYISGAAILLSTDLWKQIGGFDDRYAPAYCEDSDLAFEVRRAGKRVVYQPQSVVIHFEGISNGTDVQGTGLKRYQIENSEKLKDKWKDELALQYENTGSPDPFRARERSRGKKIILVVDHYVPTYDKDAGSKTTYQYLKMFLKMGYEIKFLGDNFLHEEPYTSTLEQMGIEVLYGSQMQTDIWYWIEDHAKDISVAYLNRPHIATKYIDFIKDRTDIKVIYYGHDLHCLREEREFKLTGNPENKEASDYWKSVEMTLMYKSDMNYYPSYVERDYIKSIDEKIPVKNITAYVYDKFYDGSSKDYHDREGILFVGGFAHPPNADAVLWFIEKIWPQVYEKLQCNFYIVGSQATDEIKALHNPDAGIIVKGFVSEEELKELYDTTRIVAVPLRYGAGVKGKVIEALYYETAVVTTSVGSEGIDNAEIAMRIADGEEAFISELISTYNDYAALKSLSESAGRYIREHNSIDAAWKIIEDDFA